MSDDDGSIKSGGTKSGLFERKLRGTARGRVSKVIADLKNLCSKTDVRTSELRLGLIKLDNAESHLQRENENCMKFVNDENMVQEFETMDDYEEQILEARFFVNEKIVELEKDNCVKRSEDNGNKGNSTNKGNSITNMPKVEMLKFNGDILNWSSFWGQYLSLIHDNPDLDTVSKFNYLQTLLTGKAKDLIQGLSPSVTSYNEAIDILKDEFSNQDVIVDKHIQNLMQLSKFNDRNDSKSMRNFYNSILTTVRSLQSLSVEPDSYELIVKNTIHRCLPQNVIADFYRFCERKNSSMEGSSGYSGVSSVAELLNFLKIEVKSLEKTKFSTRSEKNDSANTNRKDQTNNKFKGTATELLVSTSENCLFCNQSGHKLFNCKSTKVSLSDRKSILAKNKRCFRCLKANHHAKECRTKNLNCEKCKGRHVSLMCDPNWKPPEKKNEESDSKESVNLFSKSDKIDVLLQTMRVKVFDKKSRCFSLRAILDGGSHLSFIKESVSKLLGLQVIGKQDINLNTFGSENSVCLSLRNIVSIKLCSQFNKNNVIIEAIEIPDICADVIGSPSKSTICAKYELADSPNDCNPIDGIGLLVGANYYWRIVSDEQERITDDLVAVNTKFGWTVHGPMRGHRDENRSNANLSLVLTACEAEPDKNEFALEKFWDLEQVAMNDKKSHYGEENEFARDYITDNVNLIDGRVEVRIPWKNSKVTLNDNYQLAMGHLQSLMRRLRTDDQKLNDYDQAITEYIKNDWAEKVTSKNKSTNERIYYMPHRAVYKEDRETTKIRIVFNASSKIKDFYSLNESVYAGPNLNPLLLAVLLNFRLGKTAVVSDMTKAFLQISLYKKDRDSHRFLWFDTLKDGIVTEYRMKRVTFGVTCSPFLLASALHKIFNEDKSISSEMVNEILKSFYVDDFIISHDNEQYLMELINSVINVCSKYSIKLHKWGSNDDRLKEMITFIHYENRKVLGLIWHTTDDTLSIDLTSPADYLSEIKTVTKRTILHFISRIYDPLGLMGPYVVLLKLLLQEIWKQKLDWDDCVNGNLLSQWETSIKSFGLLSEIKIKRYVGMLKKNKIEVHIFADASPKAYGVVAYLRMIDNEIDNCSLRLLCSRSRVAPLKQIDSDITVPRLELMACVMSVRLLEYLKNNLSLKFDNYYLWSDSTIALNWITSSRQKSNEFVNNRVREILLKSSTQDWYHCSGIENPADLITRGMVVKNFLNADVWFDGPLWLTQIDVNFITFSNEISDCQSILVVDEEIVKYEAILDLNRFSKWTRVINTTCYVIRFVNIISGKKLYNSSLLTAEEVSKSELYWIRQVQSENYKGDIDRLRRKQSLEQKSKIVSLGPFLDDNGILRLVGRLQMTDYNYDMKHPILLPRNSRLTYLLVHHTHYHLNHAGVGLIINTIRNSYWVIGLRQVANAIVKRCVKCQKLLARHMTEIQAPLPRDRVTISHPFEITGLDFAGPLFVKDLSNKVYVVLFSCAVSRALHLEIVPAMNTEEFFRSFRRFVSRRGSPRVIYSDNAKSFKRSATEIGMLNDLTEFPKFYQFLNDRKIQWKFIIERAPWWGGFYERMVRSVKTGLKLAIGKQLLSFEELRTVITEIEYLINSRPITYADENNSEPIPLTPNDLIGNNMKYFLPSVANYHSKVLDPGQKEIVNLWKCRENYKQRFWKRWSVDYLNQLRSAQLNKQTKTNFLREGDVVLVKDENIPRLLWKIGIVENLFRGRDNKIRSGTIKIGINKVVKRSVQHLYPLELGHSRPEDVKKNKNLRPL